MRNALSVSDLLLEKTFPGLRSDFVFTVTCGAGALQFGVVGQSK